MIKVSVSGNLSTDYIDGMRESIRTSASRALTSVAFAGNANVKKVMSSTFHRGATRYTLAAFRIIKSTPETLTSIVELRPDSPGKSADYDKVLSHLFTGGVRRYKNMEGAFRRIGVLNNGQMMVPGKGCPLDSFGNPPVSLIRRLISYFGAFGEVGVGYKANMKDKTKKRLAKIGKNERGYKAINGVVYFISRGKGMWYGRNQHLFPGIWSKKGVHGAVIEPVFLFVREGRWRQFINLESIKQTTISESWDKEFQKELRRSAKLLNK